uniref:Uncharacterized protein n=1 Tax=Phytophthora ramorum TaxID=164328 RepID=H3GEA5_PHYRM
MVNISVDALGSLADSLGLHQPLMGYSTANDNRRGESDFFALSVSGINTAANTASQLVTPFAYGTPVGKTWSFLNGVLSTAVVVFASIYHELPEYGVAFATNTCSFTCSW